MPAESEGLRIALERIVREREERTGFLDLGMLGLENWPEELWDLKHLTTLNLGEGWYENGEWLEAESAFSVNQTAPEKIRWVSFPELQHLHVNEMAWTDLNPLSGLVSLQSLDCSGNQLTTLEPLAGLTSLQTLVCSYNDLTTLEPLAKLTSLQSLNCFGNKLTTLEPLTGLISLQSLNCSDNQLTTLEPLAGLASLQSLNCSENQLTTLGPLAGLTSLNHLNCWNNPLERLPEKLVWQESLRLLIIPGTALDSIPAAVPSQDIDDNCLERLRAHFRDLAAG